MAKYAITHVDEDGRELTTMTEKSKDDVIQVLMHLLVPDLTFGGVKVTYPDGSYYANGVLDPDMN